jgi:triosephosphate isomerase (TIM)
MTTRRKFIAGNWKMYTSAESARALTAAVIQGLGTEDRVDVAVCPPYPWLGIVAEALRGSRVRLGAQNVHFAAEGAFTGEVSPKMLREVGCQYAIVGHSERRHGLGEPDLFLNRKVRAALAAGLSVIYCIGETLTDREADKTREVLEFQVRSGLVGVPADSLSRLVMAYEPVWAIGTGKNATPAQAQEEHVFIRAKFAELYGAEAASRLIIQYGGSVKPDNAQAILSQPDVDGALIGGASLKADSFLAIIRAGIV